ncbi:hypothetical protein OKA05_11425 [Luteolibacter arcticus]|uniref:Uncharacterized protein n=1 Tax=Luteolibacter arcticus TaxID=1581411 RepID=A0ABT3GI31_9BACT|nr:hypothetical protein [Luteolibacter arcticus]MCW1923165.1 hypothetical protein [Luteolibacter arcticus]
MNALLRLKKGAWLRLFAVVLPWVGSMSLRAETAVVSFRSVCFDPKGGAPPVLFVGTGKGRESIRTSKNDIGGPHKGALRDDTFVDFFTTESDEKPVLSVKVPAEGRERLLFMIVPAGKGYQGSAVSLPATGFDGGATLVFNLCQIEAAVRLGEGSPQSFVPGSHRLLTGAAGKKDDMIAVQILTRKAGGVWEVVQSTRWAMDQRFRSYVFLYTSQKAGRVALLGIPERLSD